MGVVVGVGGQQMTRLLRRDTKVTSKKLGKFLKAIGMTITQYKEWLGCPSNHTLMCWFEMNPTRNPNDWSRFVVEERDRLAKEK